MTTRGIVESIRLDLRSAALFRVALAGLTLVDLAARLCDVRSLYSDDGVLPRSALIEFAGPWAASVHLASGEAALVGVMITGQLLLALAVLIGAGGRACTFASFVLLASLNARNPLVLVPGDTLLVALWLWAALLPLHSRWSPRAAFAGEPSETGYPAWHAVGLLAHVALLAALAATAGRAVAMAPLIVTGTLLLPPSFWALCARLLDRGERVRLYYDKDCANCPGLYRLLVHFLVVPRAEIAPGQEQARIRALMESRNSWVVVDGADVAHTRWRAFIAVLHQSMLLAWTAPLLGLIPDRVGDALHAACARMGSAGCPGLSERQGDVAGRSRWSERLATVLLLLVLSWTLGNFRLLPPTAGRLVTAVFEVAGLDDFRLETRPLDRPLLAVGRGRDGRDVNVLQPGAPPLAMQPQASSRRWRALQARLSEPGLEWERDLHGRYLCRTWLASGGTPLESIRLIDLVPAGAVVEQHALWWRSCAPSNARP